MTRGLLLRAAALLSCSPSPPPISSGQPASRHPFPRGSQRMCLGLVLVAGNQQAHSERIEPWENSHLRCSDSSQGLLFFFFVSPLLAAAPAEVTEAHPQSAPIIRAAVTQYALNHHGRCLHGRPNRYQSAATQSGQSLPTGVRLQSNITAFC